ncbi:MAG TPA: lysophospholipid acyltransferase family protein [Acidobacteriaceae bacterium]|nr:lysophospholipid acyltransferase family protein [Acidobacteriaceae bacterium]
MSSAPDELESDLTDTTSPTTRESRGSHPAPLRHPEFFRWLTYLVLFPLFFFATAIFGSISLIASLFDGSGRVQHSIAQAWGGAVLRIALSPVRVIGAENFRRGQAAVYVSNHLSYMDTPVVLSRLPFQFRILARHDLFKIPFIGWYLQRSGQIPVDSTSLRSTLASLNRGVKALEAGMPLVIFPEGGRSIDGHLQDFLSGPAYMAIRAQVPIVPMALIGTYQLMPMHTYHLTPRPLQLVVGTPISTQGYTSKTADELTLRVRDTIMDMYMRNTGENSAA